MGERKRITLANFRGVNQAVAPHLLEPGQLSDARNLWMRDGVLRTRPGLRVAGLTLQLVPPFVIGPVVTPPPVIIPSPGYSRIPSLAPSLEPSFSPLPSLSWPGSPGGGGGGDESLSPSSPASPSPSVLPSPSASPSPSPSPSGSPSLWPSPSPSPSAPPCSLEEAILERQQAAKIAPESWINPADDTYTLAALQAFVNGMAPRYLDPAAGTYTGGASQPPLLPATYADGVVSREELAVRVAALRQTYESILPASDHAAFVLPTGYDTSSHTVGTYKSGSSPTDKATAIANCLAASPVPITTLHTLSDANRGPFVYAETYFYNYQHRAAQWRYEGRILATDFPAGLFRVSRVYVSMFDTIAALGTGEVYHYGDHGYQVPAAPDLFAEATYTIANVATSDLEPVFTGATGYPAFHPDADDGPVVYGWWVEYAFFVHDWTFHCTTIDPNR